MTLLEARVKSPASYRQQHLSLVRFYTPMREIIVHMFKNDINTCKSCQEVKPEDKPYHTKQTSPMVLFFKKMFGVQLQANNFMPSEKNPHGFLTKMSYQVRSDSYSTQAVSLFSSDTNPRCGPISICLILLSWETRKPSDLLTPHPQQRHNWILIFTLALFS